MFLAHEIHDLGFPRRENTPLRLLLVELGFDGDFVVVSTVIVMESNFFLLTLAAAPVPVKICTCTVCLNLHQ